MDLLEKLSRKPKDSSHRSRKNKRILSQSIGQRVGDTFSIVFKTITSDNGFCIRQPSLGASRNTRCILLASLCFMGKRNECEPAQIYSSIYSKRESHQSV